MIRETLPVAGEGGTTLVGLCAARESEGRQHDAPNSIPGWEEKEGRRVTLLIDAGNVGQGADGRSADPARGQRGEQVGDFDVDVLALVGTIDDIRRLTVKVA